MPNGFAFVAHRTAAADAFDLAPVVFSGLFAAVVALLIVAAVMAAARERRRREQLHAHAAQWGWRPVTIAAPAPGPVSEAARSRRSRLVLGTRLQGFDLWLVWHQWTESTGSGDSTTSTTRNHTRYFLWLGGSYPDLRLERRSRIGAFLKPVRGIGTGDAEFDRHFLVRGARGHEALRVLTPDVRHAMMTGRLPVWRISGGVLITGHQDVPRVENLQPHADVIVYLARMLT